MTSADSLPPLTAPYLTAIKLIDEAHAKDPNKITKDGVKVQPGQDTDGDLTAYELHYARKMTRWLAKRSPQASPVLQLACRAQHFRRWEIPRSSYPMTRPGYLTWRSKLKSQAAVQITELLSSLSDPAMPASQIQSVAALIRKEGLSSSDAEGDVQVLEDVACLVFLDDQFDDFERRPEIDEEKIVGILRKTWGKMSEEGRGLALGMGLSERAKGLVGKALEG